MNANDPDSSSPGRDRVADEDFQSYGELYNEAQADLGERPGNASPPAENPATFARWAGIILIGLGAIAALFYFFQVDRTPTGGQAPKTTLPQRP